MDTVLAGEVALEDALDDVLAGETALDDVLELVLAGEVALEEEVLAGEVALEGALETAFAGALDATNMPPNAAFAAVFFLNPKLPLAYNSVSGSKLSAAL